MSSKTLDAPKRTYSVTESGESRRKRKRDVSKDGTPEVPTEPDMSKNLRRCSGGIWGSLDLIMSLESKDLDQHRKIDLAFSYVRLARERNQCAEVVGPVRLASCLAKWVQPLLIAQKDSCLDFRCWDVLSFCLGESHPPIVSPRLLGAITRVLRSAASDVDSPTELHVVASKCVALVFSSHGRVFKNATVDAWVSLAGAAVDLVLRVLAVDREVDVFLQLARTVLEPSVGFLRFCPDPKKMFEKFVKELLEPALELLVMLRRRIDDGDCPWAGSLPSTIEELLTNGLFHPSHTSGFLQVRKEGEITVNESYHRHFFHRLRQIVSEKKTMAGVGTGWLLQFFVGGVRKQKKDSLSSTSVKKADKGPHSETLEGEISKLVFPVFERFIRPLFSDIDKTDMENGLGDACYTMRSINNVFDVFVRERIYVRVEDTQDGMHLECLKDLFSKTVLFSNKLIQYWLSVQKEGKAKCMDVLCSVAKEVVCTIGFFLEIEYKVIEDDLVGLWLMIVLYLAIDPSLTPEILKLACNVVRIYSELRQVNFSIISLCKAMRFCGISGKSDELRDSRFLFATPLSPEMCLHSGVTILCSQRFRLAISSAIKFIPEGQVTGSIQQLKDDIAESLEWMKNMHGEEIFEELLKRGASNYTMGLTLHAEILGRILSEIYTLVLDSLTITTSNSTPVGRSIKDLITTLQPCLNNIVQNQSHTLDASSFFDTGKTGFPTAQLDISWFLVFFFRLYISCRSLYRQLISFMPPDSSKKASQIMGDPFIGYPGKDLMEMTDWTSTGYFSWIDLSSISLFDIIINTNSDFVLKDGIANCAPLLYILHAIAFQRLADINNQIKALEFIQEWNVRRRKKMPIDDDAGMPLPCKESKKLKRVVKHLKEEALGLTGFMAGHFPVLFPRGQSISNKDDVSSEGKETEEDAWDLGVCSLDVKSLPSAIWWLLCQNIDIWCAHASDKHLKKFLSLLFHCSLSPVRNCCKDAHKYDTEGPTCERKVSMHSVSSELLRVSVMYEQTILCRHLTSRFCRILKKSLVSLLSCSYSNDVDFSSLPDWSTTLSILDGPPSGWKNMLTLGNDSLLMKSELKRSRYLFDLLCWMPRLDENSNSMCVTHVINLERILVYTLINHEDKSFSDDHFELLRLFVTCRRTLKYLIKPPDEGVREFRQLLTVQTLFRSKFAILWFLTSMSKVSGLPYVFSEEGNLRQVNDLLVSLMDHTSCVFYALCEGEIITKMLSLINDNTSDTAQCTFDGSIGQEKLAKSRLCRDGFLNKEPCLFVEVMMECLMEETKNMLICLKGSADEAKMDSVGSVANWNKISCVMSCVQGFCWGLVSALSTVDDKKSAELRRLSFSEIVCISKLNLFVNTLEDFVNFCLNMLLVDNTLQTEGLGCVGDLPKLNYNPDSIINDDCYTNSSRIVGAGNLEDKLIPEALVEMCENGPSLDDIKNSTFKKQKLPFGRANFAKDFLSEFSKYNFSDSQKLKVSLLHSLLKGESPVLASSLRQLFIASAAALQLRFLLSTLKVPKSQISYRKLSSGTMNVLVGTSYVVLLELASHPHPFSSGWLDGILKYLKVLGSCVYLADPVLSKNNYIKLIELHLGALGKCISLQGKAATLESHDSGSNVKMLQSSVEVYENISKPVDSGYYGLLELKAGLRESFKFFFKKPSQLHLLSALEVLGRALVGVHPGCNMIYEISTGSPGGGKISPVVAAGVDCMDLVLETVSGTKHLKENKSKIQSLISALFNIVLHVRGPFIFYKRKLHPTINIVPDLGAVVLMCIEVLTKVARRQSLFQMNPCHISQSLRLPATLFQDFHHLKASCVASYPSEFDGSGKEGSFMDIYGFVIDRQFSVDLYVECCKLLCTTVRHQKKESGQCIALLEDSVRILLCCLERVDGYSSKRNDYFAWDILESVKCASFLRRIYEEIRQQKDILGSYASHFLSDYICIYSGYGSLKSGIQREVADALRPGVHALIDICSNSPSDDLQKLHEVLGDGPCRMTLKSLIDDYKLTFQYEGKI
ncbi:hypothetical protein QJS04_geneDACA001136 [Acorus gramineus]|uniref:Nucleolar 27S pre-rRNA processing Urb2/Npa2 C-terminal domain-containing protein n=1 Tax=Acorus gramineus TaxID=55184 RepID=A0AAV9ADY5_ACOGR|nr:hypothetical protein QJS04_geneDACA001136 [Acorus gramineus]